MFEQWRLKDYDVGAGVVAGAHQGLDREGWVTATVPGDTHVALMEAGRLGNPFVARNEAAAAWVADREWWWCTRFDAEAAGARERLELVFEGLDTFASIYLNGELLARTDNMFCAYRFDVGALLRSGSANELAIVFAPATASVAGLPQPLWPLMAEKTAVSRRNLIRKAQFGWGWDWGPNLPTVGVWQPVRLERHRIAHLTALRVATTELSARRACISVELGVELIDGSSKPLRAAVTLTDPDGRVIAEQGLALASTNSTTIEIAAPRLWWTADLGAQPLYRLTARLYDAEQLLDTREQNVGLRTITLDTSDDADEPGRQFFRFVLNGVPIFARGACWIPASSFVGAISDVSYYRPLLEQAVRGNMNMLRVWGGGIYEHDAFYEECDRLGLLVWQDFMFACAPYPQGDAAFVESVRVELTQQVRRLRHHPSMALWCGNNENQAIQALLEALGGKQAPLAGRYFYDELMPALLAELDPATPYWPGSPSGGPNPNPNSMRAGDVHDWTVWHGVPPVPDDVFIGQYDRSPEGVAYTRYAEDMGRFISEFGIQAAPAMATLRRWMKADDLTLESEGFLERIKDHPKDKVNGMLVSVTGLPAMLEQYIDFTMLTQAEGLKFGIEHFRRRKPHCSGTLIWQYNDCWPCISWSLVDYDGVGKAGYYATARAYAPVLASFKPVGEAFELWLTNDTLAAVSGTAEIELTRLAGGHDWREAVHYAVPANSSIAIWRGSAPVGDVDRVLWVRAIEGGFAQNRALLAAPKDMALPKGTTPRLRIEPVDAHQLRVEVSADSYLLAVQLECTVAGTQFDDNHFDLRAGDARVVMVRNAAAALAPEQLSARCWTPVQKERA